MQCLKFRIQITVHEIYCENFTGRKPQDNIDREFLPWREKIVRNINKLS